MKTATITIDTVETLVPDNADVPLVFQGFKLTVTAPSGNSASLPVDPKLVWVLGNMVEGQSYTLRIECVDANGLVIDELPAQTLTVPTAEAPNTYPKPIGIRVEWA